MLAGEHRHQDTQSCRFVPSAINSFFLFQSNIYIHHGLLSFLVCHRPGLVTPPPCRTVARPAWKIHRLPSSFLRGISLRLSAVRLVLIPARPRKRNPLRRPRSKMLHPVSRNFLRLAHLANLRRNKNLRRNAQICPRHISNLRRKAQICPHHVTI